MKKILTLTAALLLALSLAPEAAADFDGQTDYMAVMISAAATGDAAAGRKAQRSRDEKIDALSLSYTKIDFDELLLLARVMYSEAGSEWLSDEWKMAVGEVVLNRVASPEFPNSIYEVVAQPRQYGNLAHSSLRPSARCARLAVRLLEGERVLNEPSVVFQANFVQGSGVYRVFYDRLLGATYLCYSSHRGLYEG